MKAAQFEYFRAESMQQALQWLRQHDGRAKLMAGGQSLGPMLNLRLARPPVVIDISGVPALREVGERGGRVRVGAAVTHAEIEDGVHAALRGSALQQVATGIAYRAIRNRGTIGGSLAHADPAADWVLTMVALGADIEIAGVDGERMVPAESFMQGAYTTVVGEGELIAAVHVPAMTDGARWATTSSAARPASSPRPVARPGSSPRGGWHASRWARSTARPACCRGWPTPWRARARPRCRPSGSMKRWRRPCPARMPCIANCMQPPWRAA